MVGPPDLYSACAGTVGRVDAPGGFTQNESDSLSLASGWAGGKLFLSPTTTISPSAGPSNRFRGGNRNGTIEIAGAAITAGMLLQYGGAGNWSVKPYDHTGSAKCIGVAVNDALTGEFVGVYDKGTATGLPDASFVGVGTGGPLKPSTTESGKFTNGTFGTHQIIGFTRNGNTMTLNL